MVVPPRPTDLSVVASGRERTPSSSAARRGVAEKTSPARFTPEGTERGRHYFSLQRGRRQPQLRSPSAKQTAHLNCGDGQRLSERSGSVILREAVRAEALLHPTALSIHRASSSLKPTLPSLSPVPDYRSPLCKCYATVT